MSIAGDQHKISIYEIVDDIRETSQDEREKGDRFERAIRYFLKNDPLWSARFSEVWLWKDAPTRKGADYGIDLVAFDISDNSYWAIQCKCYGDDTVLDYKTVATFYGATGITETYKHNMLVTTNVTYSPNLEKVANDWNSVRLNLDAIAESELDFRPFMENRSPKERVLFTLTEDQRQMVDLCKEGFRKNQRGKLIMACGTGKTFTSLRFSEEECGKGSLILYLAPSIALVSQSMRSWVNQARWPIKVAVVCSDAKASNTEEDTWENSLADIPYPATTDPDDLFGQISGHTNPDGLTVIFSTYQSIQVVADAQVKGLPEFDLIICDEAHRTTGAKEANASTEGISEFVKVHDNSIIRAKKRLYMTATEKIYGEKVMKQARMDDYVISSMDDESVYGPEFGHISFARAVDEGLLTDYKVIALTVSEEAVSQAYQMAMSGEEDKDFDIPEAAKIIGLWKGLVNQGLSSGKPLHNAVAFCNTIAESRRICEYFERVVNAYQETNGDPSKGILRCKLDHVDGSMDTVVRKKKLDWLADRSEGTADAPVCHILSNARCLAEGVDVPSLDAVLFLQPKRSEVDIVQAVGRVMRRFEGKDYGYIILPVIIPAGMSEEEALDRSDSFSIVWKVLQALRSHDERLEARINAIPYDHSSVVQVVSADKTPPVDAEEDNTEAFGKDAHQISVFEHQRELEAAVNAQLLKRVGTRVYWDEWAKSIGEIAKHHIERITQLVCEGGPAREAFLRFLRGLRDSLNDSITEEAAIEMLAQHIITLPVFEALFAGDGFAGSNPVSIAMNGMVDTLRSYNLGSTRAEQLELEDLYESVRIRAKAIKTDSGRQNVIKELYEKFFSQAFKATSEKMGIVYTPNEVVSYMLHATDRLLREEFGKGLGDAGVHILDPFTGTGSFPVALLEDRDLISDEQLPMKYRRELHANEIVLLAYYIATINIEHAYHSRRPVGSSYEPFEGAVLTDTFQMDETDNALDLDTFIDNSERILRQQEMPIHVIIGNPPWSVGQRSANDNNANESYPRLDGRIAETYVAGTSATNKNSVYDQYIRAFRWASDRIGEHGVVCYVTNGGWIDGAAMDGFRGCLAKEFNKIYVFNLRGNQRTQGEESRREGGKIFGSGSRAPVAITMLVKNPALTTMGEICYHDIGDYLSREQKLTIVRGNINETRFEWSKIRPDVHNDWINQRNDDWYAFAPIGLEKLKEPRGIFEIWSCGLKTQRDVWTWGYSSAKMLGNVRRLIDNYNKVRCSFSEEESAIPYDSKRYSWSAGMLSQLHRNIEIVFSDENCCLSTYRPFCKQYLYYDQYLNERQYQQRRVFPLYKGKILQNVAICFTGGKSIAALVTNTLPDLHFIGDSQCFPLYWYEEQPDGSYKRHDAITDEALSVFRSAYPKCYEYSYDSRTQKGIMTHLKARARAEGGIEITREDIFYYIYGILHSAEYRERFGTNLQKELPRIPLVDTSATFRRFAEAGRGLADLHLNYETVERWPVREIGSTDAPGKVTKMKWGKKKDPATGKSVNDYSVLIYNENLTIRDIPESAQDYVVNGKSALAWLVDRYQVRTDKDSGIVNDPNDYSDDPRYIVDLIERVILVSMRTLEIVGSLPPLNEREQPENWPEAWRADH